MYLLAEFRHKEAVRRAIDSLRTSGFTPDDLDLFSEEPVELPRGVLDRPSHMSLAAVVGACILLLLAVVFAFNLGQGRSALEFEDEPDTTASSSAPADAGTAVVTGTVATDLDPQGEDREENPDLTPNAVDGNPTTSWRTATYDQQLGPEGLKTGVGLVVDLGSERDVRRIRVDFVGEPTSVSLYVTPELPTAVAGLQPVHRPCSFAGHETGQLVCYRHREGPTES